MKKPAENLMRLGAWIGGALTVLLVGSGVVFALGLMLMEGAEAGSAASMWRLLPKGLTMAGFSLSTALAAVALSFPMAWALAALISYMMRPRAMMRMRSAISGLSAIPAVVFGYLSLNYFVPVIGSPWWGVTATLMLMSLMRQTLEIIQVNQRHYPAVEAAQAMGMYMYETILHVVLPRARNGYLSVALKMLARCMAEGVAILLVLSAYGSGEDTLPTALMKAVGVTGEVGSTRFILLLALLLLLLVLLTNAVISACLEGGRHGKKKGAQ